MITPAEVTEFQNGQIQAIAHVLAAIKERTAKLSSKEALPLDSLAKHLERAYGGLLGVKCTQN